MGQVLPERLEAALPSPFSELFLTKANLYSSILRHHQRLIEGLQGADGIFAYIHYPIPHGQSVSYNRKTSRIEIGRTRPETFEAVDVLLGQVREALEQSAAWDDSMVILMSDHNMDADTPDPRVPLLIKLPGV